MSPCFTSQMFLLSSAQYLYINQLLWNKSTSVHFWPLYFIHFTCMLNFLLITVTSVCLSFKFTMRAAYLSKPSLYCKVSLLSIVPPVIVYSRYLILASAHFGISHALSFSLVLITVKLLLLAKQDHKHFLKALRVRLNQYWWFYWHTEVPFFSPYPTCQSSSFTSLHDA